MWHCSAYDGLRRTQWPRFRLLKEEHKQSE
jgi:hypothetical protein